MRRSIFVAMNMLYIVLAILTLPITMVLANLFWKGFREARGIALLLASQEHLKRIVTPELLSRPSATIEQFAKPVPAGYATNMALFRDADQYAHSRFRSKLRPAIPIVLIGSGVLGFLAFGWFGLAIPVVNLFIMVATFMGSTQGKLDRSSVERATEHVQIVAVILKRWRTTNPNEAADWISSEPQMKLLAEVLTTVGLK